MKTQETVQKWASLWLSLDIIRKANNKKTFRAQLMALFQPTSWQPAARQLQEPAGSSRSAGFRPAVGFHMPADTSSLVPRWLNRLRPDCTAGSTDSWLPVCQRTVAHGLRRFLPNMQGQEEDQRPEPQWNWIDSNNIVWNLSHWEMKMGFVTELLRRWKWQVGYQWQHLGVIYVYIYLFIYFKRYLKKDFKSHNRKDTIGLFWAL